MVVFSYKRQRIVLFLFFFRLDFRCVLTLVALNPITNEGSGLAPVFKEGGVSMWLCLANVFVNTSLELLCSWVYLASQTRARKFSTASIMCCALPSLRLRESCIFFKLAF